MKKSTILLTISSILFIVMIIIGMNGTALKPKKEVFVYAKDTPLSQDATTYFKGVIDSSRMKLDLSKVNIHQPGIYEVNAKQASRTYSFQIQIK